MTTVMQEIKRMTRAEKLQTMEVIWADLSASDAELESPAWHADVLRETEARMAAGQEKVVDWEDAKREWRQLERKHQMARTP